jgi:dTDP-glucose pyrophosphorylase
VKALVLAGGRGSRLNSVTADRNKCMCVFQGRHIIEYNLDNALRARVDEILILVGYRAETVINHYGNRYRGVPIRYVIQWELKGVVHAIETCQQALEGQDFLLLLADEVLVGPRHEAMIEAFRDPDIFALCGTVRVDDPSQVRKTYTVMLDERTGRIHRLVEKPRTPINNIQGTGNCLLRSGIFDYIPHTPINQIRQEKELPDLIQCAIDDGRLVREFEICSRYMNVNTMEDLTRPPIGT